MSPRLTPPAWMLERKYPDRWGRKDRVEIETMIRREAGQIARHKGLDEETVIAEALAILNGGG
jgi:hypothetical protein